MPVLGIVRLVVFPAFMLYLRVTDLTIRGPQGYIPVPQADTHLSWEVHMHTKHSLRTIYAHSLT